MFSLKAKCVVAGAGEREYGKNCVFGPSNFIMQSKKFGFMINADISDIKDFILSTCKKFLLIRYIHKDSRS